MRTIQRKLTTAAVLLAALLWIGCYTASPAGYAPGAEASYSYGGYAVPSGSIGFAIVSHAPRPHRYDGYAWYYGGHPHHHAHGRFCNLSGAHRHDYAPYWSHHYAFHDGYYFWVGDPFAFGLRGTFYAYQGHHRHPHYFGGYCRISGRHHHAYMPSHGAPYYLHRGVYYYSGSYDRSYYAERDRYDARGVRVDRIAEGYRDHERAARDERVRDSELTRRDERVRDSEQPRRDERARGSERVRRAERVGEAGQTRRAATEPASELEGELVPANADESPSSSTRERRAKRVDAAREAAEPASDRASPQRGARERAPREPRDERVSEPAPERRAAPSRQRVREAAAPAAGEPREAVVERGGAGEAKRTDARARRAARTRRDAAQPPADPSAVDGANE